MSVHTRSSGLDLQIVIKTLAHETSHVSKCWIHKKKSVFQHGCEGPHGHAEHGEKVGNKQQCQAKQDYRKSHKNTLQHGWVKTAHEPYIHFKFTAITGDSATYITGPFSCHRAALFVSLHPSMLCSRRATQRRCVQHVCFNLISVGGCKFDESSRGRHREDQTPHRNSWLEHKWHDEINGRGKKSLRQTPVNANWMLLNSTAAVSNQYIK